MVPVLACLILFFTADLANGIGVNWGSTTSHNIPPNIVVQMLKDNGISKVKLFGSDPFMINAFAKTGIDVMVGIPNEDLKTYSGSYENAKDWVKENVTKHVIDAGVNITYVAVGNEPFLKNHKGKFLNTTFPAIKNIQKALDEAGLGDKIKATTPLKADVYDFDPKIQTPSAGDFREDVKDVVVEMVRWFDTNNSPFLVNISPFLKLYQDPDYDMDFSFFDGQAEPLMDKKENYTNIFDVSFDTLVWSLKKAGVPNLRIMVGEIGWPTDGNIKANETLAKRFYSGFLKKLASNEGTPLRPGPIEVYLSSLLDENMKSIDRGNFERHWGIFKYDGQPKFPIDFSGQGREIMPVAAKGVEYFPTLWCVFNLMSKPNASMVQANMDFVCKAVDCTALTYGSSCNNLSYIGNISYAFNMYFQMYSHIDDSCNFNGLGILSLEPIYNTPSCSFPLQIKNSAGKRLDFGSSVGIVGALVVALLALF